jgi:hypothetical protein
MENSIHCPFWLFTWPASQVQDLCKISIVQLFFIHTSSLALSSSHLVSLLSILRHHPKIPPNRTFVFKWDKPFVHSRSVPPSVHLLCSGMQYMLIFRHSVPLRQLASAVGQSLKIGQAPSWKTCQMSSRTPMVLVPQTTSHDVSPCNSKLLFLVCFKP